MNTALSGPGAPLDQIRTQYSPLRLPQDTGGDARSVGLAASTGLLAPNQAVSAVGSAEQSARTSNEGDQKGTARTGDRPLSLQEQQPTPRDEAIGMLWEKRAAPEPAGPLRSFVEVPTELTKKIQKAREALAGQEGSVSSIQAAVKQMSAMENSQSFDRKL